MTRLVLITKWITASPLFVWTVAFFVADRAHRIQGQIPAWCAVAFVLSGFLPLCMFTIVPRREAPDVFIGACVFAVITLLLLLYVLAATLAFANFHVS